MWARREKPPMFRSKSDSTFKEISKIKKSYNEDDFTETESDSTGSSTSYSATTPDTSTQYDKITPDVHSGNNEERKLEEQESHVSLNQTTSNVTNTDLIKEESSKITSEKLPVKEPQDLVDNVDMNVNNKQIRRQKIMLIWERFEELYNKYG